MNHFYMYILECIDGTYYVGHTDDIENRIAQHNNREGGTYTAKRLPVKVVFSQEFAGRDEALAAERQVKKWCKAKKEALMKNNWFLVNLLAKKKFVE